MVEKIARWYRDQGLWTLEMVRNAVEKGVITKDDYKRITEQEY